MRAAVRDAFYGFNAPLEGQVPYFYQDVKGLVSIGVGILADPLDLALGLPMVHSEGQAASRSEIAAEWIRIKNLPPAPDGRTAAQLGHLYARPHTRLRLTPEGLRSTVQRKLAANETEILTGFPDWHTWPADAQLGMLSMAWACGPAIWRPTAGRNYWPRFTAACRARDWFEASVECFMNEEKTNPGIIPRNKANRLLFRNAAVADGLLDPEILYYPTDLNDGVVDRDAPTLPDLSEVDFPIVHPPVPLESPTLDEDTDRPPPDSAA